MRAARPRPLPFRQRILHARSDLALLKVQGQETLQSVRVYIQILAVGIDRNRPRRIARVYRSHRLVRRHVHHIDLLVQGSWKSTCLNRFRTRGPAVHRRKVRELVVRRYDCVMRKAVRRNLSDDLLLLRIEDLVDAIAHDRQVNEAPIRSDVNLVRPPAKGIELLNHLVQLRVDDDHRVFTLDGDIQQLLRVRRRNAMRQLAHVHRPDDLLRGHVDNAERMALAVEHIQLLPRLRRRQTCHAHNHGQNGGRAQCSSSHTHVPSPLSFGHAAKLNHTHRVWRPPRASHGPRRPSPRTRSDTNHVPPAR